MRETPTIAGMAALSSTYAGADIQAGLQMQQGLGAGFQFRDPDEDRKRAQMDAFMRSAVAAQNNLHAIAPPKQEQKTMANPTRRVVQVYIVDPNENVPVESCMLYKGDPILTDLTDQELFFEIDIKDVLAKHNAKRVTFPDKKVKDRIEHLEPAKVRDLKMTVVTIAAF